MAPVAEVLSRQRGVLEPFQTASSIDGQALELRDLLEKHALLPVTLIGHSWGAWLCLIFAARYPAFVKKLILIGCGPLKEEYAGTIMGTRLSRLNDEENRMVFVLAEALSDPGVKDKNNIFSRFGKLMSKADSYDPMPGEEAGLELRADINASVWAEAEALRRSGGLMKVADQVRCPVVAVHGDYDPHPAEGVLKPLGGTVKDFRFILLEKCGHEPWRERFARDRFFEILERELA
jgi:pimeloyl-ACP methyl ester carboxylesterase